LAQADIAAILPANCHVYAIDRDPSTKKFAEILMQEFPNRFVWILGNFADMCSLLATRGITSVDGIVLDLGVSSMQLDIAERGFSFRSDGKLDMRMSQEGANAEDVVNNAGVDESGRYFIITARKMARRVAWPVAPVNCSLLRTLYSLRNHPRSTAWKVWKSDPATRSFQGCVYL
jgi:16S rRNA (cytosine1402-N4)-methyltransferase